MKPSPALGRRAGARWGVACCATAMAVLGASLPVNRLLLAFPAAAGQGIRYAMAAIALALVARARRQPVAMPTRRQWAALLALALTGLAGFNLLLLAALRHANPALLGVVLGCTPLILAVAAPMGASAAPRARLIISGVLAAAGTALVHGATHGDPMGFVLALAVLAMDVAFSLLAAALLSQLGPLTVAMCSCGLAAVLLAVYSVATETSRWRWPTATELVVICFSGLLLTAGAFGLYFAGLRIAGVQRVAPTICVAPIVALLGTCVMDARFPGSRQLLGVGVVAAGMLIGLASPPHRHPGAAPGSGPPAALTGVRDDRAAADTTSHR